MKKKCLLAIIILAMLIAFIPHNSANAMSDSLKSELEEMFRDVGFAATVSGGQLEFEEGENVKPGMAFWYLCLNQRLERYLNYNTWYYELTIDQKKSIDDILKDLKSGKINVICGTHRLLSKDVNFNDLGLLILDEEQRFGVKAKEQIKTMKNNVNVLTLSATPIPRTLSMSLGSMEY